MQIENLESLKTSLGIRGFEPTIFPELEKHMQQGKPEFAIQYTKQLDGDRMVVCQLPFNKHKEHDHYFFNRYQATLMNNDEVIAQIAVKASWKISVSEAVNLMEFGQNVAVYKREIIGEEGRRFNAYISLDPEGKTDEQNNLLLNSYHDNYYAKRPFDIIDQLEHPEIQFIPKKEYDSVEALARDLQHANRIEIVIDRNGIKEDGFLGINARRGKLNFMDANGISLDTAPVKEQALETSTSVEVKKKPWLKQGPQKRAWKPKQSRGFTH